MSFIQVKQNKISWDKFLQIPANFEIISQKIWDWNIPENFTTPITCVPSCFTALRSTARGSQNKQNCLQHVPLTLVKKKNLYPATRKTFESHEIVYHYVMQFYEESKFVIKTWPKMFVFTWNLHVLRVSYTGTFIFTDKGSAQQYFSCWLVKCWLSMGIISYCNSGLSVRAGVGGYIGKVGDQQSLSFKKWPRTCGRSPRGWSMRGPPPRPEIFLIWRQLWWDFKYIPIIKMMFDVTSIINNFDNVEVPTAVRDCSLLVQSNLYILLPKWNWCPEKKKNVKTFLLKLAGPGPCQ
jgi:hypothetical protein